MSGRSEARRFILQVLFLLDQNPDADAQRIDRQAALEFKDPQLRSFIRRILDGIRQQRANSISRFARQLTTGVLNAWPSPIAM